MATVKVAVRVRPLNQREEDMECQTVVEMEGRKTRIYNPRISGSTGFQGETARERSKEFVFDYSYWSADSSSDHYASQEQVFEDLGVKVIESAFEGYNACVFAYGQTSSGKTYTMMGSENDPGLIPRICQSLFKRMQNEKGGVTYRTEVSYLEIYNEKVKDLLKKNNKQQNLRLREHPKLGPYVQDLSKHLVTEYNDVEELMAQGNTIRTTASTKMNDTSSRSHAIFTLTFVQAKFDREMPIETVSKVHLVDLAGSERADATGATGERLKEGGHINKSLVTLGSVISALADISVHSSNKTKQNFIPYRDSVLTWLLKDSLGGNSKTIMIATVSPADCNFGETLSTLRYANRAKNIVNKPKVNEDPNVKLIRELKEEIFKLKAQLDGSKTKSSPLMVEKLHENEARVKVLTEEWTERWRETQKILQEQKALGLRKAGMGIVLDSDMPHLIGIDDDILSTGVTLYHLKEGKTLIGSETEEKKTDIVLNGVGIENEHCIIELKSGVATLIPIQPANCYVDGVLIDQPSKLSQGCVILLGHTNMFRYNDPAEAAKLRREKKEGELCRSRLSFLSWSMPDLAHTADNGASPSMKLHLAGLAAENLKQMNQKTLVKRLEEAKEVIDLERKQLQTRWDRLFEREKHLLQAIDSSRYNSEEDRKFLDREQEAIETEQQFLELEEERLDEKERRWQDTQQRIIDCFTGNEDFSKDLRENSQLNGICESVLEESTEMEKGSFNDQTTEKPNDCSNSKMQKMDKQKENIEINISDLNIEELKSDERIKDIVEQEVQKHIISEMSERLQQIRSIKNDAFAESRSLLSSCSERFPVLCQSIGYSQINLSSQLAPLMITIPSFIQRGKGFKTYIEYEIKAIVQKDTWTVFRRYSKFRELHLRMARHYGPRVGNLDLPSRTLLGLRSDKVIRDRQVHLERYLLQLVDLCMKIPECPLSLYTYETVTKEVLCNSLPFLRKGLFEIGKSGTA
ncbi:Kinesin-like protein kif16b [Chamberlinius hualienensis]